MNIIDIEVVLKNIKYKSKTDCYVFYGQSINNKFKVIELNYFESEDALITYLNTQSRCCCMPIKRKTFKLLKNNRKKYCLVYSNERQNNTIFTSSHRHYYFALVEKEVAMINMLIS